MRGNARHSTQRGSSTTELVLLMPTVLLMILLVVQLALWMHAHQVAEAAAEESLAAAQAATGSDEAGTDRGQAFLAQAGGLTDATVETSRDARTVHVEVHGSVPMIVPGWHLRIDTAAEGPIEQFVEEPDR